MAVLPIYLYGSEVLRAKAHPVKELDNSVVKLIYDMFETMHKANGIGLAATQVGDMRRVIVIDISDVEEGKDEGGEREIRATSSDLPRRLVLINPEILSENGKWVLEEGCLSIPEVRAEVERAEQIRFRYRDANFKETVLQADGLLARVILHEIDHLDGVLFIDRISSVQKAPLKEQLKKIKKGDVETTYPVISAAGQVKAGSASRTRTGKVEV
jgi:peptide deformylase